MSTKKLFNLHLCYSKAILFENTTLVLEIFLALAFLTYMLILRVISVHAIKMFCLISNK